MIKYCKGELPLEACGLLAGGRKDGNYDIEKIYCLSNADGSGNHFSMIPEEQFCAIRDMREKGYELLGNFHSHPRTEPLPSKEDIRLAYDPQLIYLILSLKEERKPELEAYSIDREGNVIFEQIIRGPCSVSRE
ncbi:MAG: M67 family metallopeptidase [Roseburia sp.]|nr:M67 family metallopeptidase [Roseburia sp.]